MFKFWQKSPKHPPPAARSPSSKQTPPHPSTAPAKEKEREREKPLPPPVPDTGALQGLGLSVPGGGEALDGLPGGLGGRGTGGGVEAGGGGGSGSRGQGSSSRRGSAVSPSTADARRSSAAGGAGDFTPSPAAQEGVERTTSPLSFSPSMASSAGGGGVVWQSPYGAFGGGSSGGERDPSQIYAPTTWSEMAHQELVVNVSSRERTRQEILWEVVASEERYVAELRSLVDLYANPLLHPLFSPSPNLQTTSPYLSPSSPLPPSTTPSSSPNPNTSASAASSSSASLPIAARFARSTGSLTSNSGSGNRPPIGGFADIPEIDSDPPSSSSAAAAQQQARKGSGGFLLGRSSLPALPTGAKHNTSVVSLDFAEQQPASGGSSGGMGGRLAASFGFGRTSTSSASSGPNAARHPLRPAPSSAKLHKSSSAAPAAAKAPPPLPEAMKAVLEATVEMLRGHEELSARLKDRWAKDFPLVRGLAGVWSDQPWFLQCYATYVVSLEPALSALDTLLPSAHSPSLNSYASKFARGGAKTREEKDDKKLAKVLMGLEEQAAEAGESSLSICLSKPLMRLGKLPLLMQALLYHTDPTTHEWEKTRAMALEVDALVRSIEDEKIEEEERERTRDILARIDGINDKALMAPRSSRVVLSETPAPDSRSSPSAGGLGRRKSVRKSSSGGGGKERSTADDWLITFSDVAIRAQKVGQTNIPGSFSREKEKQGKQGKTRKTGKLRNTYRFIRVERWENREPSDGGLDEMDGIRRAIPGEGGGRHPLSVSESEEEGEDDDIEVESRMSFRYDTDEPVLSSAVSSPSNPRRAFSPIHVKKPVNRSSPLAPTTAKFGTRLRVGSEDVSALRAPSPAGGRHRFDSPTLSSQLKASPGGGGGGGGRRAASTPAPAAAVPPRTVPPPTGGGMAHAKDESTFGLYSIWAAQDS
ncbi:hypothetical protein JCM10213_007452 [Rhodosporidiobolus nylandii]